MKKIKYLLLLLVPVICIDMTRVSTSVNDELLRISREYLSYSLYNSQDYWTLAFCEPYHGPGELDDSLHFSHADKKSPHGNRLYKLYVKDKDAYHKKLNPQPVGQVMIKEVWNVREVPYYSDSVQRQKLGVMFNHNNGKCYTTSTRKELFIMYKTEVTAENDAGWWYGIVDMEKGKDSMRVVESRKIDRCVKCHMETKFDRVIGVPE